MKLPRIMAFARPDSPLRVTLHYVLFGTLWIVGSDWWVAWRMAEPVEIWKIDTLKGVFFILATAGLLYVLTKRLIWRHITMEDELRVSQQRLALALEAGNQGLYDLNVQTGEAVVNDTYATMLGYDPKTFRETNAAWHARLHPDDRDKVYQVYTDYVAGRLDIYRVEFRQRAATGEWLWVLSMGRLVARDDQGRPLRMLGTHTDITARRSAEAQSADALAFAQAVLHSSPVGVIAYGPDGRAVIANEAAARIVGTDVEGLLRQNFREIESWRRHGLLAAAEESLATGREVMHSGHYVSSFGRDLWLEEHFVPFNYAGAQHLLILVTDETASRRTRENLKLMETAVQAAPVGWVVTDPEGLIQWVNPGFTALTGYAAEEVIGQNPRVLKSGRHRPEFYAAMWATIKRGEVWTGEMFNQRKDGVQYHERMTIAPVRGEDDTIAHYVAIKQDITGEKQLEQQLARAQRLESIGMLASGIAHDLNNIFAPILLSLELLKLKYPMADARRMLDTIESAGQRGAGIVRQVLTFARGIEGERTEVQPKYLVKEMAQILGETLPRNIRVETQLAARLSPVLGDATQLHQVLLNLAINARDAMPVGGRLVLGAGDVLVDDSRAARNPPLKPGLCVAFTVADTGSGIPPEVLERMFEPFFTTKPIGKGTGLGLSTVYGIVRSHGGAVEVKTTVGEGTEFCVLLPAMPRTVSEPEAVKPGPGTMLGAGRRILVVDDEETIRIVTAAALQRHGFVVETAEDGAEGLGKFLQRSDFAAVVTDLMMPRMNGYEMAREIRRHDPRVPILASSGMTGDSAATQPEAGLAALGIKTLLLKPYAEGDLLRALAVELDPTGVEKKD
jgi:PAS domain S-box-containing protein